MSSLCLMIFQNQRQTQLNNMCHIISTPGRAKGVEVSFQELLKERVQDLLTKIQNLILKLKVLRLKYQEMGQG